MRGVKRLLILSLCSSIMVGCASVPSPLNGNCYNKTLSTLLDSTDLKALFQDLAFEICSEKELECVPQTQNPKENQKENQKSTAQTCIKQGLINPINAMVTDFADIQTFIPNQSGLLMGELMRGSLNKVCDYKIVQAEFAKYFKLSENGLVVLTRHASEIKKDEYSQQEAIVGTYNYLNNNKVLLFVRKINTQTGKISRMVTREINYTCSGRSVLGYTIK